MKGNSNHGLDTEGRDRCHGGSGIAEPSNGLGTDGEETGRHPGDIRPGSP